MQLIFEVLFKNFEGRPLFFQVELFQEKFKLRIKLNKRTKLPHQGVRLIQAF